MMARPDRLVSIGLDAERDPDEHPVDTHRRRPFGLAVPVEDDRCSPGRAARSSSSDFAFPVYDELLACEPGGARERELAERGHVRADALTCKEAKYGHVRERLRPVEDGVSGAAVRISRARARIVPSQYATRGVPKRSASTDARTPPSDSSPFSIRAESGKSSSIGQVCLLPFSARDRASCVGQGTSVARAADVPMEPLAREAFLFPEANRDSDGAVRSEGDRGEVAARLA